MTMFLLACALACAGLACLYFVSDISIDSRNLLIAGIVLIVFALLAIAGAARAEDCREGEYGCGHHENHEQFKTLRGPDGGSCCESGDCRFTVARPADGPTGWEVWDGLGWAPVPKTAMLKPDILGVGRTIICGAKSVNPDTNLHYGPYCVSIAEPKS